MSTRAASCAIALALLLQGGLALAREGDELVGTPAAAWGELPWLDAEPMELSDLRGKVVLVRWWTDTCPYCAASAPALNELHDRFSEKGLRVVGIYHPKPLGREFTEDEVREAVRERGFRFPVALDGDWAVLRRWWLEGGRRRATSVSFLVDRSGRIRHVHPGPAFHREVIDGDTGPARDFAELERTIEELLAE